MESRPNRPSRPVATITCSSCGLQQPLSMDCAGCRKSFSLEELNAARSGGGAASPAAPAAPSSPAAAPASAAGVTPSPASPDADLFSGGPVFRDEPATTPPTGATADDQVFADDASPYTYPFPKSETDDDAGDVYDPNTAAHRPTSGSRYHIGGQADLSAGDLIQETFEATFANFLPVAIVTVIVSIPVLLYTLYLAKAAEAMMFDPEGFDLGTLIFHALSMVVVAFLCQLLGSAALTHVIGRWLRDETVVLLDSIGVAVRSLGVLVVMLILQGIGVGIGFLLLIVPGIILAIGWSVAAPAVVIERLGVTESLARSWKLTQGNRLSIFFAFLILNVINWLVDRVAGMAVSMDAATTVEMTTALVFTALQAVLTALIYFKLLAAEEGVPIDQVPMSVDAR